MKKEHLAAGVVFVLFTFPWCFCLMYWDIPLDTMDWYPVVLIGYCLLGWYCGKTNQRVPAAAGSAVSCILSVILAEKFLQQEAAYFYPLGITGTALFFSAVTASCQVLIWRWQQRGKETSFLMQFLWPLAALFLGAMAFILAILLWAAFDFQ